MQISSKAIRVILLTLALVLSGTALGRYSLMAEECGTYGATRFVQVPGVCCSNWTQKWKGQSCMSGTWEDNGAAKCEGFCAN